MRNAADSLVVTRQTLSVASRVGVGGLGTVINHHAQIAEDEGYEVELYALGKSGECPYKTTCVNLPKRVHIRAKTLYRMRASKRVFDFHDSYDQAVARHLDGRLDRFTGFVGMSLHSFRRCKQLGAVGLDLVAANSHVFNVTRLHKRSTEVQGMDDSWLHPKEVHKTLAEYQMADRIFVHSQYTHDSLRAEGVDEHKLQHTTPAIADRFHPPSSIEPDGRFRVVYVGRVEATKGIPLLVKGFSKFPDPSAELTIVGGWSSRQMRVFLQEAMRRDPRIRMAPGDPVPALQKADVFVHPTFEDGFAYAPMEALACGVPVIVTEDTGMKEFVREGVNGYVVPTGDADAILERLVGIKEKGPFRSLHSLIDSGGPRERDTRPIEPPDADMRIGHYCHSIWAHGGMATYIRQVGDGLRERGHEIVYFSSVPADEAITVESHENLCHLIGEEGLDVLNVHSVLAGVADRRLPIVRTVHNNTSTCISGTRYLHRKQKPCDRKANAFVCSWGHLVDRCGSVRPRAVINHSRTFRVEQDSLSKYPIIAVSSFLERSLVRAGCPPDLIRVVRSPSPEPVTAYQAPSSAEPVRFLFMGRVSKTKGLAWLVKVFSQTPEHLVLDVAGDGYHLDEVRALARRLQLQDRVTFHGWMEQEALSELIVNARAVIFPSLWHEPAGLVTLEAAAYGRPVITTTVGGIPEYADSQFARLVPPGDDDALQTAIEDLADDPEAAARMGRRGLDLAQTRFSREVFLDQLEQIYGAVSSGSATISTTVPEAK